MSFAQNKVTWIGGTPGQEDNWHEPRNWDQNIVPDVSSHVVIKKLNTGHFAQPVISDKIIINSLDVLSGAELNINMNGQLTVDGEYYFSTGNSIYGGNIVSKGEIIIRNVDYDNVLAITKYLNGNTLKYSIEHIDDEFLIVASY